MGEPNNVGPVGLGFQARNSWNGGFVQMDLLIPARLLVYVGASQARKSGKLAAFALNFCNNMSQQHFAKVAALQYANHCKSGIESVQKENATSRSPKRK